MSEEFQIGFEIDYHGAVPGSLQMGQREFNDLRRAAWFSTGKYWMQHFRAKHFTKAGAAEYQYSPRKGETGNTHPKGFWASYTRRKQRDKGHTLPLVWTGESRRRTRRARITARATSTKSHCRIAMNAPTLNRRHKDSDIRMWDEMTRVSPREIYILLRHYERFIDWKLRALQGTTTKRIAA